MLFQRINRTDPEKIFIVVKNSSATTALTQGYAVAWEYINDADGVQVDKMTGVGLHRAAFAGIVYDSTIAAAGYGLIQVYGHCAAVRAKCDTSAKTGAKGGPLMIPKTSGFYLLHVPVGDKANPTFGGASVGIAGAAYTKVSTSTTMVGFIKALG